MKVSAKGRYGLITMTYLAQNYGNGTPITTASISKKLGISKIYLEQVFSLLKRAKLVESVKGAQGGYYLLKNPAELTVWDVLSAIEMTLMEDTVAASKIPEMNTAINKCVYEPLDKIVAELFQSVTLQNLVAAVEKESEAASTMYYI